MEMAGRNGLDLLVRYPAVEFKYRREIDRPRMAHLGVSRPTSITG